MNLANKVTLARIIFTPLVLILLFLGLYGLAAFIFTLLCFSDAIDGYIARRYKQISNLGKVLDPLADKLLVLTVLIALTGLQKVNAIPVILLTVREFIIHGIRVTQAQDQKVIHAIPIAKWKTTVQMLAIFMLILSLPLAEFTLWLSVILALVSSGVYLWQNRTLHPLK